MKQKINLHSAVILLRTAFIALFVLITCQPAIAQSDMEKLLDKYADMKKAKDVLEKRVGELELQLKADTTKLIKRLTEETANLNGLHKKELNAKDRLLKDTVKVLNDAIELKNKELKVLQKELKNSGKETLERLEKQVADLTAERDRLKKENDELIQQKQLSVKTIAERDAELKELLPIRELKLKETLDNAKEWALLPFSQLKEQEIAKLIADCQRYGGNNADFKKAVNGLNGLQADLKQYVEARALLDRPFNEPQKNAARQQLKTLMAKYRDKPQLQDLTDTDVLLRDYDGNVMIFQDMIDKLNAELEDGGRATNNKVAAYGTLEYLLNEQEMQENIREIEKTPYLKKRLSEYLEALKKNPLQHWSGEAEIKNMVK